MTNRKTPCARCGVQGERRKTTVLCSDCRSVLSPQEVALWKAQGDNVESSHRKDAA